MVPSALSKLVCPDPRPWVGVKLCPPFLCSSPSAGAALQGAFAIAFLPCQEELVQICLEQEEEEASSCSSGAPEASWFACDGQWSQMMHQLKRPLE